MFRMSGLSAMSGPSAVPRKTLKAAHGEGQFINVFPALPASLAVDFGRVWMPKSDLALNIYDNNRLGGFMPTITLGVD
jgi:hypothetical protein